MKNEENFNHWIGKKITRDDIITPRLIDHFKKTFYPNFHHDSEIPPCFFWCLAPDSVIAEKLGNDGHPLLGIYLPDLPYKGRMWAGGEIKFLSALTNNDQVTKTSTIKDIQFKSGRSGNLCFVSVEHLYHVKEKLCVNEIQNIVYREDTSSNNLNVEPDLIEPLNDLHSWKVHVDSTMLFRYSAITFNGHKIHYDLPFSKNSEGHRGLLTHGPMQATLIANLASHHYDLKSMKYRGLSPLVCGDPFTVEIGESSNKIIGRVISSQQKITMQAEINYE